MIQKQKTLYMVGLFKTNILVDDKEMEPEADEKSKGFIGYIPVFDTLENAVAFSGNDPDVKIIPITVGVSA